MEAQEWKFESPYPPAARLLIISSVTHGGGACVCVCVCVCVGCVCVCVCVWAVSARVTGSGCLVTGNLGQWQQRKSSDLLRHFVCPSQKSFGRRRCRSGSAISQPAVQKPRKTSKGLAGEGVISTEHEGRNGSTRAFHTQTLWLHRTAPLPFQGQFLCAEQRPETPFHTFLTT